MLSDGSSDDSGSCSLSSDRHAACARHQHIHVESERGADSKHPPLTRCSRAGMVVPESAPRPDRGRCCVGPPTSNSQARAVFSSPPRAASSRILRALRRAIRVSAGERVLLRERPREDSDDGDGNWAATLQRGNPDQPLIWTEDQVSGRMALPSFYECPYRAC